ncbi:MAG: sigma-70 family RNA polymerase sigma factor [Myxococcota bacterium]
MFLHLLHVATALISPTRAQDAGKQEKLPTVRELVEAHGAYIWRTLRYLGIPESDVPDLTQEVFLVVHRKLPEFEGRSTVETWLYGICYRVAAAHRRRAHVRRERPTDELPEQAADDSPFERAETSERLAVLREVLGELSEDRRAVFVLYEIEELQMKEVAEIVGCPVQTAYSRLHAARSEVRHRFERILAHRRAS